MPFEIEDLHPGHMFMSFKCMCGSMADGSIVLAGTTGTQSR